MISLEPIVQSLLETPYAKQADAEHVYVRCPLCGDSTKHHDGAHCSIWVKAGQPLIYHCWICEESGIVDQNFLNQLEVQDASIVNIVGQYNKASSRGKRRQFQGNKEEKPLQIPVIRDNENSKAKLAYMQERLGINFTYRSMESLKIIFSLEDYLALNKLPWNKKYAKSAYYLDRDYIGFLSTTRDFINMRNITKDPKYRYIKYPVFQEDINYEQMYMLPTQADIYADDLDLHICEGPFDILGVFFHVMERKLENQIYGAVNGSAYARIIRYILKKGFLMNLNIWIYSDKDKDPSFYYNLIRKYRPWVKSFHIMYNDMAGEKDFGVPKDRIRVREIVL